MVVPLGPAKFYGSSLPRPRIYNDTKFNSERIDPPPSASEPLLKWASEAHWSMGGLSSKRKRMQGKIEGSIKKIRAEKEKEEKRNKEETEAEGAISPQIESPATLDPPLEAGSTSFVAGSDPKPSPNRLRVPSRARKLGDVFEERGSQKKGAVPSEGVAKGNSSNGLEVSDWVPVPDKFVHVTAGRTSPRKKDKHRSHPEGFEPVIGSRGDCSVRRSSRLSASAAGSAKVAKKAPAGR